MKTLIACLLVGVSCAVLGLEDWARTPQEEAMCQKRVYARKRSGDPGWNHMHHYCDGLRFYERAVRTKGRGDFDSNVAESIGGHRYVLSQTAQNFHMRPEVLVMLGRAFELAGKKVEAGQQYIEALRLNPNFSMAYAALGNFNLKNGDKAEALRVYAEGLKRHPKNRYLLSRYKAAGGNPDTLGQ
ncbi:MAG: tetratricopeptide repeat protein [Gammaproteobacteria bacterium]